MKQETYKISFEQVVWFNLTPSQVLNFVSIAMLKNKDISKATIERM